jgi:hypothetical protein
MWAYAIKADIRLRLELLYRTEQRPFVFYALFYVLQINIIANRG